MKLDLPQISRYVDNLLERSESYYAAWLHHDSREEAVNIKQLRLEQRPILRQNTTDAG